MCSVVLIALVASNLAQVIAADRNPEELPSSYDGRIITYRRVPVNETVSQLGARLYDKVDYELQLQKLDSEIKLTKARLTAQTDRIRVYDKYYGRTRGVSVTRQNAHLAELESELRLKELRKEKQLLLRHRRDKVRYRELLLEQGSVELDLDE